MIKIIFFSSNMEIVNTWKKNNYVDRSLFFYDAKLLKNELPHVEEYIIIADYDSVASDINHWISSSSLPSNLIVLERVPEIATGKMLISRGVKAYGNSRMLSNHFTQMLDTVKNNKIWTYPSLTAKLAKMESITIISEDAKNLIENRLSKKEIEVVYLIMKGLVNNAIALKLNITTRTVKAHVSSIFSKLHINDRVSLILLLK